MNFHLAYVAKNICLMPTSTMIFRMLTGIQVSTVPKLIENDISKFSTLLNDIFPTADSSSTTTFKGKDNLHSILANLCETQGLHDSLISRCIQLNDQLQTRSGAAIVGPPGSGKSLIIKTLAEALSRTGESVKQFQIYPGAISKLKLLGAVDPQTR